MVNGGFYICSFFLQGVRIIEWEGLKGCANRRGRNMALLQILLLLILSLEALVSRSQGKVLRGEVNSRSAWETKGIFLAKFGFHGALINNRTM